MGANQSLFWSLASLFGASYSFLFLHLSGKYDEFSSGLASLKSLLDQQSELLRLDTVHVPVRVATIRTGDDSHDVCTSSATTEEEAAKVVQTQQQDTMTLTKSPLAGYVDHVVESYGDILSEVIVGHTESWNYVAEYEAVDETTMGSCPIVRQKIRSGPQTLPEEVLEEFEWDDESDIPDYLEELLEGCSRNAFDPRFKGDCWDYLEDLIYTPRCTTRFDSRISCKEEQVPDIMSAKSDIESILDGHFAMDTLNVVVVGSGPTGLFLANALAHGNSFKGGAWKPEVRVTIIENRVEAVGVKQGFVRNWQTIPQVEGMASVIDPRVGKIFAEITDSAHFALPLNAIETLLLLSTRDLGVKFLYGNLTDYTPFLSTQPNLLVFDATGHRLDGLVRGSNCPKPDLTPGIEPTTMGAEEIIKTWTPLETSQDWYYLKESDYEIVKEYNSVVNIAQKGNLLYPVSKDGIPYATWWLHVHEIPSDQNEYDMEYFWGHTSSNSELCKACTAKIPELIHRKHGNATCQKFCSPNNFFESGSNYRRDIAERMELDESSVWFATRGANVALVGREAKRLLEIIEEQGYSQDPVGMPMSLLPLSEMAEDPVFKGTLLLKGLEGLAEVDDDMDPPIISVFQHRPYIYMNGKMKGGLFGPSTPMLRIGDSLATGDPNRSSGFVSHVWMLRRLVCRVRGEDKECSQDY